MPIDTDDLEPQRPKLQPLNLDAMSIAELEGYIGQLTAEIDRVKSKIAAKKAHHAAVQGLFGKPKP